MTGTTHLFPYDGVAAASILETSLDAAFTIDQSGVIADLNPAAVTMFGWSREELLGANISIIVPSPLKEQYSEFLRAFNAERGIRHVLGSGQRLDGERKDGTRFPVEVSISTFLRKGKRYFIGFVRDMTERQRTEDQMRFLATHDADSGLLNLGGFVSSAIVSNGDEARVVVFRLEEFRHFATIYGRQWYAATLREVALRLASFLHPDELAAGLAADTFAILIRKEAARRTKILAKLLRKPYSHGIMQVSLTTTIAISFHSGTLDERLRSAMWACDRAGAWDKGGIHVFTDDLLHAANREAQIETVLPEAIKHGRLSLALQAKVRLSSGRIAGAEALVRWVDPELGQIPPSEFIPIAERLGLVGHITDWVLHQSVAEVCRCPDPSISVAVNFSALDFFQPRVVQQIHTALTRAGAHPARLVVELTESVVAHDAELVKARMGKIKALGTAISLDDFGTGYSSLSYLRRFPIDSLKIDASFVRDLPGSADAIAIVTAIVALAKALHLETIAEGVENEGQAEALRALEVDLGQGYLFSRPVPPVEFHQLVEAQSKEAASTGRRA